MLIRQVNSSWLSSADNGSCRCYMITTHSICSNRTYCSHEAANAVLCGSRPAINRPKAAQSSFPSPGSSSSSRSPLFVLFCAVWSTTELTRVTLTFRSLSHRRADNRSTTNIIYIYIYIYIGTGLSAWSIGNYHSDVISRTSDFSSGERFARRHSIVHSPTRQINITSMRVYYLRHVHDTPLDGGSNKTHSYRSGTPSPSALFARVQSIISSI